MADMYFTLGYEEFKELEKAMKAFKETSHGEGTPWYHKSVRIPIGEHLTLEFHGPGVKARMAEE